MWIVSNHADEKLPLKTDGSCFILMPVSGLLSLLSLKGLLSLVNPQYPKLLAIP